MYGDPQKDLHYPRQSNAISAFFLQVLSLYKTAAPDDHYPSATPLVVRPKSMGDLVQLQKEIICEVTETVSTLAVA
jgi:hypothetical protein